MTADLWSAVTCHRFTRMADLSAMQSRVQRFEKASQRTAFDVDKSPANSGDRSPHSKLSWFPS